MPVIEYEDGIKIAFDLPPTQQDIDDAYKAVNPDAGLWETARESLKSVGIAASGMERAISSTVKAFGEFVTSTGERLDPTAAGNKYARAVDDTVQKVSRKVGTYLTKIGQESIDYWTKIAPKPDPSFWSGKFTQRNTWQKSTAAIAGAIPSFGAAAAITASTGNPWAGAATLGTIYGADEYERARKANKSIEESGRIGLLNTVGNTVLEMLPLHQFLKAGKPLTRAAVIGLQEGTEEVAQQLWTNAIAKHGYDATREYADGVVLAGIAGAGSGGLIGGLTRGGYGSAQAVDAFEDKLRAGGATDEQIDVLRNTVAQQVASQGANIEARLSGAEVASGIPPKPPQIAPEAVPTPLRTPEGGTIQPPPTPPPAVPVPGATAERAIREQTAVAKFGTTEDPTESLYLTTSGTYLGNKGFEQGAEHRQFVDELVGQVKDTSILPRQTGMLEITDSGPDGELNVRAFTPPTEAQLKAIKRIAKDRENVFIDDYVEAYKAFAPNEEVNFKGKPVETPTFNKANLNEFIAKYAGQQPRERFIDSADVQGKNLIAAFRDPRTNQLYRTGSTHDLSQLPPALEDAEMAAERQGKNILEAGFVTPEGTFLSRAEAGAYQPLKETPLQRAAKLVARPSPAGAIEVKGGAKTLSTLFKGSPRIIRSEAGDFISDGHLLLTMPAPEEVAEAQAAFPRGGGGEINVVSMPDKQMLAVIPTAAATPNKLGDPIGMIPSHGRGDFDTYLYKVGDSYVGINTKYVKYLKRHGYGLYAGAGYAPGATSATPIRLGKDAQSAGAVMPVKFSQEGLDEATTPTKAERVAEVARGEPASHAVQIEDRALHAALHTFENAEKRWGVRRKTGLSDAELLLAIGEEFGTQGGHYGQDFEFDVKGGTNPKYWFGRKNTVTDKPTLQGKTLIAEVRRVLGIPTEPTQAERVKVAVKEEPKSIEQVQQETQIKRDNIRRILGVGTKEGIFERVDKGVYVLKRAGQQIAIVETADALDALPRRIEAGEKYDMVFLDPPYYSPALVGGNRGIKDYEFVTPRQFHRVMQAIGQLVASNDTHVYLMLSGARTAQPDMTSYIRAVNDAGFKTVGEGRFKKLFQSGAPVTNVRGDVAAPERLILLTKSGAARATDAPVNLDFAFVRPTIRKGFQSEKPTLLLKALIEQSTLAGETVLDPFAGTGVAGEQAVASGRKAVLIEKAPARAAEAMRRVEAAAQPRGITQRILTKLAEDQQPKFVLETMDSSGKVISRETFSTLAEAQDEMRPTPSAGGRGGGTRGEAGGYANVPLEGETPDLTVRYNGMDKLVPLQLPELVQLHKSISPTGAVPELKKFPRMLGRAPYPGGIAKVHPWIFLTQEAVNELQAKVEGPGPVPKALLDKWRWVQRAWQPNLAQRVLAHEIGHLVDWLPDQELGRGNAIGHAIVSTTSFMKEKFGDLSNRELRKELKALTQYWKPFDDTIAGSYRDYRYSSVELYGDFISVLLNDPKQAQALAPKFTQAFFDHLDAKPDVRHEYARLQQLVNAPDDTLLAEREGRILEGYVKAADAANLIRAKALARRKSFWFVVKDVFTADAALRDLARETVAEPTAQAVNRRIEDMATRNGKVQAAMIDFNHRVWQPLQKAGALPTDLGLYVQLTRISKGDRSAVANPQGFTVETAEAQLGYLKKRLGDTTYAEVERLGKAVRDWYKQGNAEYPDLFTAEQRKTIEGNDYYAPFQVVDYLENWIGAGFAPQVGTLKDIRNPLDALVMKRVAVILTGEKNVITKDTLNALLPHGSEAHGLMPAEVNLSEGRFPQVKKKTGYEAILWKEAGEWKGAYAEPSIAQSFNRPDNRAIGMTGKLLAMTLGNKVFRAAFITLSPGFQSVNFLVRDPGRTWVNLGLRPFKGYLKAIAPSLKRVQGEFDPLIQQMLKEGALQETLNDRLLKGETEFDTETDAIFHRYGGTEIEHHRNILTRIFDALKFGGDVLETIPKVAAFQALSQKQIAADLRAYMTRHYVGTPQRRPGQGHQIYNNAFMFSEMFKEGWRADLELARNPTTRMGWWLRTFAVAVLPAVASVLAAAGYLGKQVQQGQQGASEYLKTNYTVLPIGEDDRGKPLLLTIPIPDTQRVVHGIAWKILSAFIRPLEDLREGRTPRPPEFGGKEWEQLMAFGAGSVPSPAPAIELIGAWASYLTGGRPRDMFRDQDILTEDELRAGGIDAFRPMWLWTINQFGFTKFDLRMRPEQPISSLERMISLTPGVNRFLRVTDYGLTEALREAKSSVTQSQARERLERRRAMIEGVEEGRDLFEVEGELELERRQRSGFRRSYRRQQALATGNPILKALAGARSTEEQVAVLEAARVQFSADADFEDFVRDAQRQGLISRQARNRALRKAMEMIHTPR